MGQGDCKTGAVISWRLGPELPSQPLERRVEWIEARPLRTEAAVLVPRGRPFLDPCELEERFGELVAGRPFAAVDLLPRLGPIGQIVAEPELCHPDRVEYPPSPALVTRGDHGSALRTTRARWTSPGLGSSRAKTAST